MRFDVDLGEWLVDVTQVDGFVRESELLDFDPTPDQRAAEEFQPEPSGEFITRDELFDVVFSLREAIREVAGVTLPQVAELIAEERVAVLAINAEIDASQLPALRDSIIEVVDSADRALAILLADLESTVVTTLSEITNRVASMEAETLESSGLNFLGFLNVLGGFILNPFDWFMTRVEARVLEEINDGLDR